MDTYPIPAEQVMVGEVHARLTSQQQAIDALTDAMAQKYREVSEPARNGYDTIARNAKKSAKKLVAGQGKTVADLIQTMGTQAGQYLVSQEATKDQLQDAMFRLPNVLKGSGPQQPPPQDCPGPWYIILPNDSKLPCYASQTKDGDPLRPGSIVAAGGATSVFPVLWLAENTIRTQCYNGPPPLPAPPYLVGAPWAPYPCLAPPTTPGTQPGLPPPGIGGYTGPPIIRTSLPPHPGRPGSGGGAAIPQGGGSAGGSGYIGPPILIPPGAGGDGSAGDVGAGDGGSQPPITHGITGGGPGSGKAGNQPCWLGGYMLCPSTTSLWCLNYVFPDPNCTLIQSMWARGCLGPWSNSVDALAYARDVLGVHAVSSGQPGFQESCAGGVGPPHLPPDGGGGPPSPPVPPFIPPPPPPPADDKCVDATPGSSCDCPLYVVTCAPPPDPLPDDTCPADTGNNGTSTTNVLSSRAVRVRSSEDTAPTPNGGPSSGTICYTDTGTCDDANVPLTGSDQWCDQLKEWVDYFHGVGANLLGNLNDPQSSKTVPGGGPGFSLQSIALALGISMGAFKLFLKSMYNSLHAVGTGDACAIFGIWFARWCLSISRNFEVGIRFIAHLTIHLGVDEAQLTHFLDYVNNYVQRGHLLNHSEIWEAYRADAITEERMKCLLAAQGIDYGSQSDVLLGTGERLSVHETIELGRRNKQDDDNIVTDLAQARSASRSVARKQLTLYDELPTISDHLHWLARNVDDTDYVQKYALLDGFSTADVITSIAGFENYRVTTETHGRDFWKAFGDDLRSRGMKMEYAARHYAAHWVQPAPTQMREFVYRLSPDIVGQHSTFTIDDFKRILIEQDYAPKSVQWFADTVYHVMPPTYARELYQLGMMTDEEYKTTTRKQGYSPEDSELLTKAARATKDRQRTNLSRGITPAVAGHLVRLGLMPEEDARTILEAQGFNQEEQDNAIFTAQMEWKARIADTFARQAVFATRRAIQSAHETGIIADDDAIDNLKQAGAQDEAAQAIVSAANAAFLTKRAGSFVKAARKAFMDAEIDVEKATSYLTNAGLQQDKVQLIVEGWQLEMDAGQKILTASQVLSLVRECLIPAGVAQNRLVNLGWSQESAGLLVAQAAGKCGELTARRIMAAQRSARAAAKELARLKKEAAAEVKRIEREIMHQEPESLIRRMYVNGRITAESVRRRLSAGGYDSGAIEARLRDWNDARERAQIKEERKTAKTPAVGTAGGVEPPGAPEPIPSHPPNG